MINGTYHIGLSIKPNEHGISDVYLEEDGNLAFVTGAKAVGEHARQRLMTYRNEWFLDTNAGMTWLDEIMAEKYNPALTEALVKAELINTDGVKDMVSFSVRFDRATRHLKIVDVQTTTDYEEVVQI